MYLGAAPLAILVLCTLCVGDTLEVEGEDAEVASGRSTHGYTAPATVTIGAVGTTNAPISLSTNVDTTAGNLKLLFKRCNCIIPYLGAAPLSIPILSTFREGVALKDEGKDAGTASIRP